MSNMNMSMHMGARLEQRMKMTKQMIQSVEMLHLPLMVLQEHIREELESNPALEMVEDDEPVEDVREDRTADVAPEADADEKNEPDSDEEYVNDYSQIYGADVRFRYSKDSSDKKMEALKALEAPGNSLRDDLVSQAHLTKSSSRMKILAELIIGNLDDDGYLRIALRDCFLHVDSDGELRNEWAIDPPPDDDEMEIALFFVQSLEPAGVGARTVQECLSLQLKAMPQDTAFEQKLVASHLEDLAHNRLKKIATDLGVDIDRVKRGLDAIRKLNPHPGGAFSVSAPQYIVPDVIIRRIENDFHIDIVKEGLPLLRVNDEFDGMYKNLDRGSKDRDFLRDKMQSARWLIDSINQRHLTLRRIAEQIVDRQREFLEHGIAHLKPLLMQDIADAIEAHVSTISRAVAGKYVQTPQGLLPMKFFFSAGFQNQNSDGESESNRAIMERIRSVIDSEDKRKPFSDQYLVEKLKLDGIDIARRTVAKYRENLKIPSSRQRKAY